jgi:hypothetical protein
LTPSDTDECRPSPAPAQKAAGTGRPEASVLMQARQAPARERNDSAIRSGPRMAADRTVFWSLLNESATQSDSEQ